jgi:hypothetical protein
LDLAEAAVQWNGEIVEPEGSPVRLLRSAGHESAVRIELPNAGQNPWEVAAYHPQSTVARGTLYEYVLVARADRARSAVAGVWQSLAPWGDSGLFHEVQLDPEWKTLRLRFSPDHDEPSARPGLWIGGDETAVEVAELHINPVWKGSFSCADGTEAKLLQTADERGVRVEIEGSPGIERWSLCLYGQADAVRQGELMTLVAEARADADRSAIAGVWQQQEPWHPLGLFEEITVKTEWKEFVLPFFVDAADPLARPGLWLGGCAIPVEVRRVQLVRISIPGRQLTLSPESMAELRFSDGGSVRIEIEKPGSEGWEVSLYSQPELVRTGDQFAISVTARSTAPRPITVGAWQAHEPWHDAGLCRELSLTTDWQTYTESLKVVQDDQGIRFGLWAGANAETVEIREFRIERVR